MASNKKGRKPDATSKSGQIRELLKTGMSAGEIAKKIKCTPALVYNVKARASGGGPKKPGRKPGRPAKAASISTGSDAGLSQILAAVKQTEQDRVQMRQVLEKVRAIIDEALG